MIFLLYGCANVCAIKKHTAMSRATIKDVAQLAQVSTTTVSHVVNNTRAVNPATRARVLGAMSTLGYQPNILARSLRKGVTKTIGLIVPDASNPFFAEVARKIEDLGFKQGYSVILCNSDNDPIKQTSYINTLLAKRVDGVIFISSDSAPSDLSRLVDNHIPLVVADRDVSLEFADVVLLDNERAGYEATRHLLELGHRNIACITGPYDLSPSMQRMEGFKRCLSEFGIQFQPQLIQTGDFSIQSGKVATLRLLSAGPKPTAIFALNDMMAIGAMSAVNQAGLSIPGDMSLIGFDNIELAGMVTPSLTTVAQPIPEIARQATSLLIERLAGTRNGSNQKVILSAELLLRDSTARLE